MTIQAYICDIDDTLLGTTPANLEARDCCIARFIDASGLDGDMLERTTEAERRLYLTFGWAKMADLWRALAIELDCDRPSSVILGELSELFENAFFDSLKVLPTVIETLEALKDGGAKLGIISNGDEELQQRKLKESGLEALFDNGLIAVTIQNDYYNAKPATANFKKLEGRLNLRPREMLYVGDKPWDVAAANVAGWTSVRTTQVHPEDNWPSPPMKVFRPDFTISEFAQLREIR